MSTAHNLPRRADVATHGGRAWAIIGLALIVSSLVTRESAGQSVRCGSADVPGSLVRILRQPPLPSGTGIVIVRRSNYVIILTAKHVVEDPSKAIAVSFAVAMDRTVSVPWTDATVFGFPLDGDLAVFRVNGPVPAEVVSEDPFTGELAPDAPLIAWGHPAEGASAFCSYEGRFQGPSPAGLVMDRFVDSGVSGGPLFLRESDGKLRLVGVVNRGDGDGKSGRAFAIDVRLAATLVSASPDPANGGKPHVWPNIVLLANFTLRDDQLLTFRLVPAGDFEMGSNDKDSRWPASGGSPAGPRSVTLPAFYLTQYEVTVGQYRRCLMADKPDERCTPAAVGRTTENFPVVGVNWYQARQYARWLEQRLRTSPQTPRDVRRLLDAGWTIDLPSEAEWEKGARFDKTGMYPWGKDFSTKYPNFNNDTLKPVGSTECPSCAYGLADMAGNAREWTRSLKLDYPYVAARAEDDNATGKRAIRGGSARQMKTFASQVLRAANREEAEPTAFDEFTGFRVALVCRVDRGCTWAPPE